MVLRTIDFPFHFSNYRRNCFGVENPKQKLFFDFSSDISNIRLRALYVTKDRLRNMFNIRFRFDPYHRTREQVLNLVKS